MRQKLTLLDDLQEIDLKVDALQGEKEGFGAQLNQLDQTLAEATQKLTDKGVEIETVDTEKGALEENLAIEQVNITRSEANLKGITTQKEYLAVSKEISTAKKLIGELEEQILQKISTLEQLRGEEEQLREQQSALEQNLSATQEEIRAKIAGLDAAIAADAAVRAETAKALPPAIIKRYDRLREQRRGLAVVEARDGSCLGCNMSIPPQMYNNLFRGDELITCPHCNRILVLRQTVAQEG
ncbi:zinc ribbon domain-containing protein [Geobacter argillaceus]|uniref:Uncharacterized protein n=1 Tax=Geobacter argillaceus TaxID=345631 RepID=A0A562WSK8_9BACT|nr:C4-type zinc ribbon domain-containing protein [Geobacter argillaceus]TWJ33150.1 hypothetical protein JN12_00564 [Geobacter argillaceus]